MLYASSKVGGWKNNHSGKRVVWNAVLVKKSPKHFLVTFSEQYLYCINQSQVFTWISSRLWCLFSEAFCGVQIISEKQIQLITKSSNLNSCTEFYYLEKDIKLLVDLILMNPIKQFVPRLYSFKFSQVVFKHYFSF